MNKKLYPYINRHNGEVQILSKSDGAKLNEDWSRAKIAVNEKGEKVFRFEIATPVLGPDGKMHQGIATVDISEVQVQEVKDGNKRTE